MILAVLLGGAVYAQTFNEWFRQKRTQRRYLVQQIIALQAYIEVAKKGYEVVEEGLDIVGTIRDGDWKQFIEYFGSLEAVNPYVRKYRRLQDIINFNKNITDLYAVIYKPSRGSLLLTDLEWSASDIRFDALLKSCYLNLLEVEDIITPGKLAMKDDERLKRIDNLYGAMATNYSLAWHICKQVVTVSGEREFSEKELEVIKRVQLRKCYC